MRYQLEKDVQALLRITENSRRLAELANEAMLPIQKQMSVIWNSRIFQELNSSLYVAAERQIALAGRLTELDRQLRPALESFAQYLTADWVSQFADITRHIQSRIEQEEAECKDIAPALLDANLWISPSIPIAFMKEMAALTKEPGLTGEDVQSAYLELFRANSGQVLNSMVNTWSKKPHFVDRMQIISDSAEAHLRGKYTLSIPALLPQIEGIASDIAGKPAGKPTTIIKEVIFENYPDFLAAASKDILLELIPNPRMFGSIGGQYFTREGFVQLQKAKGISAGDSLNRHAILHGIDIHYANELNSIRAFLILDMLSFLNNHD